MSAKCTDVLWIPLVLGVLIGFVVIASIDLNDFCRNSCFQLHKTYTEFVDLHTIVTVSVCLGIALLLSLAYTSVAFYLTGFFIVVSVALYGVANIMMCVYHALNDNWVPSFTALLAGCGNLLILWVFRRSIKNATKQWKLAVKVCRKFPSTIGFSFVASFVPAGITVLAGLMVLAGYGKMKWTQCSPNQTARTFEEFFGLLVYVALAAYILIGFTKSAIRCAASAVFGYWFYGDSEKLPIVRGLKLATTYSAGSICAACSVSALITGLAHGLGYTVHIMTSLRTNTDLVLIIWIIALILDAFDFAFQIFNQYVLIFVVNFNLSYGQACIRSWRYFTSNKRQTLIIEYFSGCIYLIGCHSVGAICAFACYLYLHYGSELNVYHQHLLVAYVHIMCSQICSVLLTPVITGLQTLAALEADQEQHKPQKAEKPPHEPQQVIQNPFDVFDDISFK